MSEGSVGTRCFRDKPTSIPRWQTFWVPTMLETNTPHRKKLCKPEIPFDAPWAQSRRGLGTADMREPPSVAPGGTFE